MSGIGGLNETELHEQLKHLYAGDDGTTERGVEGFVVDVVRGDELVEIQSRGFAKLRRKITTLAGHYRLRIVHPIAAETLITKLSDTGELVSSRRSPRKGRAEEVFRELTSIADLLPHPAVTVDVVLVRAVETRVEDGRGSWRRHGVSIVARRLGEVVETRAFVSASDYLGALPPELGSRFTNGDLMDATGLSYRDAQPMTSALRKMGLLRLVDKRGREQVYEISTRLRPRRLAR
ncbi:MAG: hypothetical protein ACOCZB_05565 [Spirochaetota bacterium]